MIQRLGLGSVVFDILSIMARDQTRRRRQLSVQRFSAIEAFYRHGLVRMGALR